MKKIFFLFLCSGWLVSCKKKVTELPDPTQSGANTFGAKVNGIFWAPKGFGPFPSNNRLEARISGNYITMNARNFAYSPNETEFEMGIYNITGPGTYLLNTNVSYPNPAASYGYYVKRNFTPINEWITSSSYTGKVIITKFDVVNRIVSGTFEFNALNMYNAPEPMSVTEGRFDVKWQ